MLAVVVVLHDVVFGGRVSFHHPDFGGFFLPRHCLTGRSLAEGVVPAWNPYAMGGAPFAGDPLSGWMSLPVMTFYSLFSCEVGVRIFIIFHPVLAGLSVYWFLRGEGTSRAAATVGGLSLSLAMSASVLVMAFHFAGIIAWSAALLAAGARCFRARTWPARWLWVALTALVWGQLAVAFVALGVILGTGLLIVYGLARYLLDRRAGAVRTRDVLLVAGLLALSLPLVNLAFILPVLGYLGRTTLSFGYDALAELAGEESFARTGPALSDGWVLRLSSSPGPYMGGVALCLAFSALFSKRLRALAIAFMSFGTACYLLTIRFVIDIVEPLAERVPGGDIYLHRPERMRYGALVAVAVLAGLGLEAWRSASPALGRRLLMIVPGLAVWGLLPLMAGADGSQMLLFLIGTALGIALLLVMLKAPRVIYLVPVLLAIELTAGALLGQHADEVVSPLEQEDRVRLSGLKEPRDDVAAFFRPDRIARALNGDGVARALKAGGVLDYEFGSIPPTHLVHEVEEPIGYTSVQKLRYWLFVRTVNGGKGVYNKGIFRRPQPSLLSLFQVGWVIAHESRPNSTKDIEDLLSESPTATRRKSTLYEVTDPGERASLLSDWRVVSDPREALDAVTAPGFDSYETVVLEKDPGIDPGATRGEVGEVSYAPRGTQGAHIEVDSPSPAVLVIRNVFDKGWEASIDGEPVAIQRADYLMQAIPVPEGSHEVEIAYKDPLIGLGLAGSGASILVLLALALLAHRRRSARTGKGVPSDEARS